MSSSSSIEELDKTTQEEKKVVGPTSEELESYSELMKFDASVANSPSTFSNISTTDPYNNVSDNDALESLLSEIFDSPLLPSSEPLQQNDALDKSFDSLLHVDYIDNLDSHSNGSSSPFKAIDSSPLSLPSPSTFSFDEADDYFNNNVFDLNNLNDSTNLDLFSAV